MIKKEMETKDIEVITDVICNKCGDSLRLYSGGKWYNYGGVIEATVEGCYESKYITDGTLYKFSLCEKCFDELRRTFKIDCSIEDEW